MRGIAPTGHSRLSVIPAKAGIQAGSPSHGERAEVRGIAPTGHSRLSVIPAEAGIQAGSPSHGERAEVRGIAPTGHSRLSVNPAQAGIQSGSLSHGERAGLRGPAHARHSHLRNSPPSVIPSAARNLRGRKSRTPPVKPSPPVPLRHSREEPAPYAIRGGNPPVTKAGSCRESSDDPTSDWTLPRSPNTGIHPGQPTSRARTLR